MPRIEAATVAEHHALKRGQLIAAAARILAEEGPTAVTPAAVATGAGLARSSVYQYYDSTGALLGAAFEETFRQSVRALEDAVAAASGPGERLTAYVHASLDAAVRGHLPTTSYAGLSLPPECAERLHDLHRLLVAPLVETLRRAGADDPEGVAGLIGGVVAAAATQVRQGRPLADARAASARFVLAAVGLT